MPSRGRDHGPPPTISRYDVPRPSVLWIGRPGHVLALLQIGHCLGGGLLGDAEPLAECADRHRPADQMLEHAEWVTGVATRQRVWELYRAAPPPLGYDFWSVFPAGLAGPAGSAGESPSLLRLTPYRVRLTMWRRSAAGRLLRLGPDTQSPTWDRVSKAPGHDEEAVLPESTASSGVKPSRGVCV